jgi:hypothetical protein
LAMDEPELELLAGKIAQAIHLPHV